MQLKILIKRENLNLNKDVENYSHFILTTMNWISVVSGTRR